MKKLRFYQENAISGVRKKMHIDKHKRVLIYLATGGGKSVIFGKIGKSLFDNGKKVIFVVRRRQLIFQANEHMRGWGVDSAMLMAGKKPDTSKRFQVCSIDTINARISSGKMDFLKDFDAVIVDEAHDTTSPTYRKFFSFIEGKEYDVETFLDDMKQTKKMYVGLTATPFEVGRKIQDFWESCVKPIEISELVKMGFLTKAKVFMTAAIDTTRLKVQSTGDFKDKDIFDAMAKRKVVGDIVQEYKDKGEGKRAILFAVNIVHSQLMRDAFLDAGISAVHCDQSTSQKDRDHAISEFKKGNINILCNVNIFSTGVDIPQVEIGLMARPTASEILWVQQLGRILRPFKVCAKCQTERGAEKECYICKSSELSFEKNCATIMDFGENTVRFGLPEEVRDAILTEEDFMNKKGKKIKKEDGVKIIRSRTCPTCFAENHFSNKFCEYCQEPFSKNKPNEILTEDGVLLEITPDMMIDIQRDKAQQEFKNLCTTRDARGFKKWYPHFKLAEKYYKNQKACDGIIPRWVFNKIKENRDEKNN